MLISFVLLCINILIPVHSQEINRTYLIKKDFVSGLKGPQFTVYDTTGQIPQYRIESKFGATHDVQVFSLPSKELLGRLKTPVRAFIYKATITIFDNSINQWINGTIERNFKLTRNNFTIIWNENTIIMEGTTGSLNTAFIEQPSGNTLAQFQKSVSFSVLRNKYDLQVLSNKYPDVLYFLGVAARDRSNKRNHRG
jgi:hypothetical protein